MSNIYYFHLDTESKKKYLEKLEYEGITLPDPLDTELRLRLYKSLNPRMTPNVTFGDIYMFLVETEHTYTREELKNYKNLDCYSIVSNAKVRDVVAYKCENTNMCVLSCDIESNETRTKLYRTWAIATNDGMLQNGHCTCMKGLENVCCHVAALLFYVENANKKEFFNKDAQSNYFDEEFPESVKNRSAPDYFENHKKKYVPKSTGVLWLSPDYKSQLKAIKKIVPDAPIFTLLSDVEFSSSDEENVDDIYVVKTSVEQQQE